MWHLMNQDGLSVFCPVDPCRQSPSHSAGTFALKTDTEKAVSWGSLKEKKEEENNRTVAPGKHSTRMPHLGKILIFLNSQSIL